MEEEKKSEIKEENSKRTKPKRKVKITKQMQIRLISVMAIAIMLVIAIIIGIVSNITKQTSTSVGKRNSDTSQTSTNENEANKSEEPKGEENNELKEGNTSQEGEKPQEEPQQPVKEPEVPDSKASTDKEAYYIKVNNQANVVTIYKKDANGKYTIPYKAMVCSIGTATPTDGVYRTSDKYTWRKLFGHTEGTYVYGQYATRIVKSILFHSVPYQDPNDPSSLEYWEYDKLGTKASAGCVRLTVEDAKWIYDNCAKGTQVEFYSSADPGPLGKPTARKISNEASYVRGWDPTDPSGSNPWRTYNGNTENKQQQTNTNNNNQSQDNNISQNYNNVTTPTLPNQTNTSGDTQIVTNQEQKPAENITEKNEGDGESTNNSTTIVPSEVTSGGNNPKEDI